MLWLPVHITDEKFSAVSAMEHSDQQLQLYAMTEGSCFTILTEIYYMVVVQMATSEVSHMSHPVKYLGGCHVGCEGVIS